MKTQIETLKQYLGTYQQVARILGITERHLRNVRDGKFQPSQSLRKLIEMIYESYKSKAA
jgi:DNA-binding transcriptional regulator YiaG